MTITPRHLAALAGTFFAATAVIDIPHEQAQPFVSTLDYVLEALFALALAFSAATLWSHRPSEPTRGRRVAWAVPALGYTVTYAIGNTLLTIWGMVLIMLLS